MANYETLGQVVPGVLLCKFPHSKSIYARVYRKDQRTYINRSTGFQTEPEARQWVMENLGALFQVETVQRGGGSNSITRLLSVHIEFLRKRHLAGEISESTFIVYEKLTRHFTKWFPSHGFKKLGDIKRASLQEYPLNRCDEDGMARSTSNLEVVFLKMWWSWLNETEVISRPITIRKLKQAVELRTSGEPFAPGDLQKIHNSVNEWISEKKEGIDPGNNLPKRSVSEFNKQVFKLFLDCLEQSGCRQHEILQLTWKDVEVTQTLTKGQRIVNELRIPHRAKRGFRIQYFLGDSLLRLKDMQRKMCPKVSHDDYLFRAHQTNTLLDKSNFSRYWKVIQENAGTDYPLHTYRSYRVTELVMSGVEPALVARNLGLSVAQILKTYLRFVPASNWDKLVMKEKKDVQELRTLISSHKEDV